MVGKKRGGGGGNDKAIKGFTVQTSTADEHFYECANALPSNMEYL